MRPARPVVFERDSGTRPQDIMGTTYAVLDIVSDRFVDALLEERVTGWATYPVRLRDADGRELPGYHGLAITGRAGPIDWSKGRIELIPPPVPRGQAMYAPIGMYFDPETWDGREMFIPQGTAAVCVLERVRRALENRKLSNLSFEALAERRGNLSSTPPG